MYFKICIASKLMQYFLQKIQATFSFVTLLQHALHFMVVIKRVNFNIVRFIHSLLLPICKFFKNHLLMSRAPHNTGNISDTDYTQ